MYFSNKFSGDLLQNFTENHPTLLKNTVKFVEIVLFKKSFKRVKKKQINEK